MSSQDTPSSAASTPAVTVTRDEAQRAFLVKCISIETDAITVANATAIRDAGDELEHLLRGGLNASRPFDFEGLGQTTPIGLAASLLSDMAHHLHTITGKEEGDVPSRTEEQVHLAASGVLRRLVTATLDTVGVIRTSDTLDGNRYQTLEALCARTDAELIERCVASGMKLPLDYVARMEIDTINKLSEQGGVFAQLLEDALQDPATRGDARAAINRADAFTHASETTLKSLTPQLRNAIDPFAIDAALEICVREKAQLHVVKGLLALGANPLGARSVNPAQPSALWTALKDAYGVDSARELAKVTPDLNESHRGVSLLARACERRDDALVEQLAQAGAKFANPQEATLALVNGAEVGLLKTVGIALDQGAGVDDIESSGIARTALITAGLFNKPEIVILLLDRGADPGLRITKSKMVPGQGLTEIETDFLEEVLRVDAVDALHAAAIKIGPAAVTALKASDQSPNCSEFIAAVRAKGAIPDRAPAQNLTSLQDLIALAQANGTQVIGVGPGGATIGIGADMKPTLRMGA